MQKRVSVLYYEFIRDFISLSNRIMQALNMPSKRRGTVAKEIVDQTLSHLKKQRENLSVTRSQTPPESERPAGPSEKFEPTTSFSHVFSETVGKKTRPSVNIRLKENPRLINLSEESTQQSKENRTEQIAQMRAQEPERKPSERFEPTADFHKVFSGIIGRRPRGD